MGDIWQEAKKNYRVRYSVFSKGSTSQSDPFVCTFIIFYVAAAGYVWFPHNDQNKTVIRLCKSLFGQKRNLRYEHYTEIIVCEYSVQHSGAGHCVSLDGVKGW